MYMFFFFQRIAFFRRIPTTGGDTPLWHTHGQRNVQFMLTHASIYKDRVSTQLIVIASDVKMQKNAQHLCSKLEKEALANN